jgi:putative phosphoribosyl transferase
MSGSADGDQTHAVRVPVGTWELEADLTIPEAARSVVLFAHGSGSSRFSSRNRIVARALNRGGLATLLMDLLTPAEGAVDERTRHLRFDIELLADRLGHAAAWLASEPVTSALSIGCFGSSTGAAAALVCAARHPDLIHAVVSRGGRPDLAGDALASVIAPTLLIVGGEDRGVIGLNEIALEWLQSEKQLEIVADAGHLFEEPGALDVVAALATNWFGTKLSAMDGEAKKYGRGSVR